MLNPFLVGEKVYLRPVERADAPLLARFVNAPAVRRSLLIDHPLSVAEEEEFVERLGKSREEVVFGIALRQGDRLVGVTGLHLIQPSSRQAQFGIFIGEPSEWGKGYGTEATKLVLAYAFETLNMNRVWLHVFEDNAAGIRTYEKVGFKREGTLRQAIFREGRYFDLVTMAVLQEEWRSTR